VELSIHLPIDQIAQQVNQTYDQVIVEGELPELGLRVKIQKRGKIEVGVEAGKVLVKAPLEIYTKVIIKEKLLGWFDIPIAQMEETDFEITAFFETKIEENEYWELSAGTVGYFEWDRRPQWNLVLFKVRLSTLIKPFITGKIDEVARQITHFVEKEIGLAKHAKTAWEAANKPILISEKPAVWLHIHPANNQNYRRPIHLSSREISAQISLPVNLTAFLGKEPSPIRAQSIPPFYERERISNQFQAQLTSNLPYQDLCDLFIGEQVNLDHNRLQFHVRSLGMKMKDEKLNTMLSIKGFIKRLGAKLPFRLVMFVTTVPFVNKTTGRVKIKLIDHAFMTHNWWLRIYNRLARKSFQHQLTQELNRFIEQLDDLVVREIKEALKGQQIDDMLRLSGELEKFQHSEIEISKTGIALHSQLRGSLRVEIQLDTQG